MNSGDIYFDYQEQMCMLSINKEGIQLTGPFGRRNISSIIADVLAEMEEAVTQEKPKCNTPTSSA